MVHHDAPVHHHLDPGLLQPLRERLTPDPELEPHRARLLRHDVFEVRVEIVPTPEHVHDVDGPRHVDQLPVDGSTEDLRRLRVVHWHRHHVVAGRHQVLRHVEGRLAGLRLRLDAENGDALGAAEEGGDVHSDHATTSTMLLLGLESSCDETGASVVSLEVDGEGAPRGTVRSDVVHSQVALHAEYGGVIPELTSRDHAKNVLPVLRDALKRAGVGLDDLDAIAVTHRPGLVGALLVGVQVAKGLAWATGKPLVGVDHLMGHLLAIYVERDDVPSTRPALPFVALLASGGHSAIYRVDGLLASDVRELGATRDDAAGEAFDKVAKLVGLGYPGGPAIDRLAATGDPETFPLEAPMYHSGTSEMSFSGIKTRIAALAREHGPFEGTAKADLCASFQRAVTRVLAKKLLDAASAEGVRDVVIGGGVAANSELRRRVTEGADARGMRAHLPDRRSCTDNAAMIAYAGGARLVAGRRDGFVGDGFGLVATSTTSLPRATRKGRGRR